MFDRSAARHALVGLMVVASGVALVSCSDDDEPAAPDPTYEATARVRNALVGDGAQNTSIDIRLGSTDLIDEDIQYLFSGIPNVIGLPAASGTVTLEMLLTGTAAVLNPGHTERFSDREFYVLYAIGDIRQSGTATSPTLLRVPARPASPAAGTYTVIFIHALAGNPDPIDIYVDGSRVATGLGYGEVSDARSDDVSATQTVVVTPEGSAPGAADLYRGTAAFFNEEEIYLATVLHEPAGNGFGDANRSATLWDSVYE